MAFDLGAALEELVEQKEIKEPPEEKTYRLDEIGVAEKFADQYRENVRFVSQWKKWIYYDGKRWQPEAKEKVRLLAHETARSLYIDAANESDSDMRKAILVFAKQACKSSGITAMLKEASAMLAISVDELDKNRWLFNLNNCTLNLKTGSVQPHNKNDFITKIAPIDFDPNATAPIFEKTLSYCLGDDPEIVEYVQRFFGYCLSGSNREQCLCIWHGFGQNGKSTILNIVSHVFGDYAQTTKPETLMVKYNNSNTSDIAKLKGARLVTATEGEDGHRLAESAIKQMTGGEKIQARFLYAEWFEYEPEFKIILCTNHKPVIRGTEHAIWRRIRLIPFTVTIPEADQDKDLPEKLKNEIPGILKWVAKGAANWLVYGLDTPEKVKVATAEYKSEQNVIRNFLDCECVEDPEAVVGATDLYKKFAAWLKEEKRKKVSQTTFGTELAKFGYEKGRQSGSGKVIYPGIGLLSGVNCSHSSQENSNCSQDISE